MSKHTLILATSICLCIQNYGSQAPTPLIVFAPENHKTMRSQQRRRWTKDEDNLLNRLIVEDKIEDWKKIAKSFPGRTSRQCRDHWNNYTNPEVSHKPWTFEEDLILLRWYQEFGASWQSIAAYLPERNGTACKNRWHSCPLKNLSPTETTNLLASGNIWGKSGLTENEIQLPPLVSKIDSSEKEENSSSDLQDLTFPLDLSNLLNKPFEKSLP